MEYSKINIRLLFEGQVSNDSIGDVVNVISIFNTGKEPTIKDLENLVRNTKIIDSLTKSEILVLKGGKYSLNEDKIYELAEKVFGQEAVYF